MEVWASPLPLAFHPVMCVSFLDALSSETGSGFNLWSTLDIDIPLTKRCCSFGHCNGQLLVTILKYLDLFVSLDLGKRERLRRRFRNLYSRGSDESGEAQGTSSL